MKILIIKTSALGDIIQAFPVLNYLHRIYPKAVVDWVVEEPFIDLVQAHPYIHQVIPIATKKWRQSLFKQETRQEIKALYQTIKHQKYDIVFDLQGNIKSGFITALTKSPLKVGFGYLTVKEGANILFTNRRYNPPNGRNIREDYLFLIQSVFGNFTAETSGVTLKISEQDKQKIQAILSHLSCCERPKVMVCPGSNWTNKQLSKQTLKAFLNKVANEQRANFLFVWGSQEEKKLAEELAKDFQQQGFVLDRMPLPTLQNLMTKMNLVIAMDSLPLHLAGTTSTPTYSIFGASSALKYKPVGLSHHAFQGICPYQKQFEKRCALLRSCSTGSCIKNIEGERLYAHFAQWWSSIRAGVA